MSSLTFESQYIDIPQGRKAHVVVVVPGEDATPPTTTTTTLPPVVLLHGLGSSASFWLPALMDPSMSAVCASRKIVCVDLDGHGLTQWSGQERGIDGFVDDLEALLDALAFQSVVLVGHSMSGIITSTFTAKNPSRVDKLFLLQPVLVFPSAGKQGMLDRATAVQSLAGRSRVAQTVSTTGVSPHTLQTNPLAVAFIRHLVLSTDPGGYAAACKALANSGEGWKPSAIECRVHILGGEADYMAGPQVVEAWAKQVKNGSSSLMPRIGHWGGLEAPGQVAAELAKFLEGKS